MWLNGVEEGALPICSLMKACSSLLPDMGHSSLVKSHTRVLLAKATPALLRSLQEPTSGVCCLWLPVAHPGNLVKSKDGVTTDLTMNSLTVVQGIGLGLCLG